MAKWVISLFQRGGRDRRRGFHNYHTLHSSWKPGMLCGGQALLLETLDLCDGEHIVHVAPRVNVCSQGAVHRHAEHVSLVSDDRLAVHTAQVSELLHVEHTETRHLNNYT